MWGGDYLGAGADGAWGKRAIGDWPKEIDMAKLQEVKKQQKSAVPERTYRIKVRQTIELEGTYSCDDESGSPAMAIDEALLECRTHGEIVEFEVESITEQVPERV